jgi:uncharacterized protein YjiS (DUF1127 family)
MRRHAAKAELRHEVRHAGVAAAVSRLIERYETWLDDRAARRALYAMNEQGLADIGLSHPDFAFRS